MSGYVPCACGECFEIAIGYPGDVCWECRDAGCGGGCECPPDSQHIGECLARQMEQHCSVERFEEGEES